jgi:hypothetical protein
MSDGMCVYESRVAEFARLGREDDELQAHIEGCMICQDIVKVSTWMQSLAKAPGPEPDLPQPAYLWWKSQTQQRQVADRKLTHFIRMTRPVSYLAFILGLLVWARAHWPQVQENIGYLSTLLRSWLNANLGPSLRPLVYLIIVLLMLNAVLTFCDRWLVKR